jgi:hypothetical protein
VGGVVLWCEIGVKYTNMYAAVAACSSLVLLSYGPQLLALQKQVVAW